MITEIIFLQSNDDLEPPYTKFVLLERGTLLFGKFLYHKDLVACFFTSEDEKETVIVIGAGIVPEDVTIPVDNSDAWGKWISTGYDVVTPLELRESIREALIAKITSYSSV